MDFIWTLYGIIGRQAKGLDKNPKIGSKNAKKCLQNTISCPQNSIFTVFKVSFLVFQWFLFQFIPETLKYWVGVQRGQSYLMGRSCLFSHGWRPFQCWCHDKKCFMGQMLYIDQLRTPCFPIVLFKAESGLIARSVEIGLER